MHLARLLFVTVVILTLCRTATGDPTLFDNGTFSGPQEGRNASGPHWVIDDFHLAASSVVTGIEWSQHDEIRLPYDFTEVAIYASSPADANLVASFTVAADRTPNGTPVIFQFLYGFDYTVSGLSITLGPGTYWLGIRSQFPGGGATWDQTAGTAATTPGRYQFTEGGGFDPLPGRFWPLENSTFRILGKPASVPEPVPFALIGLALFVILRRYRG